MISNLFKNKTMEVNTYSKWSDVPFRFDDIQYYDIVNINETSETLREGNVYLIYCEITCKHCWGVLHRYNWNPEEERQLHLVLFLELIFDENNNFVEDKRLPNLSIIDYSTNYVFYCLLSSDRKMICYNNVIPRGYKIITNSKKNWYDYCDELNLDQRIVANLPINKISHMREIYDTIGSFL